MSNRLTQMLKKWQSHPELEWVLATLISVEGSSYRKPGAMMLINSLGQYEGLLSGGCLEADVIRQARQVMESQCSRTIIYDMNDEDDLTWQLGIGCGGKITILLQSINQTNHYLHLPQLLAHIEQQKACYYVQAVNEELSSSEVFALEETQSLAYFSAEEQKQSNRTSGLTEQSFYQLIKPNPHIGIFGGGIDAQPLVNLASELGWTISLADPRPAYARVSYFQKADRIVKCPINDLIDEQWLQQLDVAIVMHHNIKLDAQAIDLLQHSSTQYIGLLGPEHRTATVFEEMKTVPSQLVKPLSNPVGLNLGGDMPETIALSIISEAQAVIEKRDARSFSLSLKHTASSPVETKPCPVLPLQSNTIKE